jgi:hypothetical protein
VGRNYIAERTWADPKQRAAHKAVQRERDRMQRTADALGAAQYRERSRVCWVKGCDKPSSPDWMGCCSEQCHRVMLKELDRRDEVKQARRQGIPVAEYRKQIQK